MVWSRRPWGGPRDVIVETPEVGLRVCIGAYIGVVQSLARVEIIHRPLIPFCTRNILTLAKKLKLY